MKRLPRSFFLKPSLMVARALLGTYLVRQIGRKILVGKIVETESYPGPHDRASHAWNGKITPRNRIEYEKGGYLYIYLVYGMYWQLNITTGPAGHPECVLIRALQPIIQNNEERIMNYGKRKNTKNHYSKFILQHSPLTNGPGKLCKWLRLNKYFYGEDVTKSRRLWIAKGENMAPFRIAKGPRIGIDYAGAYYAKKPWRFYLKNNPFVSKA